MGGATVEGMMKADYFDNKNITVSDPSEAVLNKFSAQGINVTTTMRRLRPRLML